MLFSIISGLLADLITRIRFKNVSLTLSKIGQKGYCFNMHRIFIFITGTGAGRELNMPSGTRASFELPGASPSKKIMTDTTWV